MAVDASTLNRMTVAMYLIPVKIQKEKRLIQRIMCPYIHSCDCYIREFRPLLKKPATTPRLPS